MTLLALGTVHAAHPHFHYPRDTLAPNQFSDNSRCTDRSIWNIVWSCLATIFACTWIAIHQNIPAPNERAIRVFGRRLAIMFYMLIAPELVIAWAVRQYLTASEMAKRHKARGWTKTHAFFLIMGGFYLYKDGIPLGPLEYNEMKRLEKDGKIEWPTITETEIKDKSKGDFFSKGVVVMQTTWFIIQCIVRGSKGMVLTELEVVTLAFATLTMIIYGLWWHKPLDVQVPVPVHLKEGRSADEKRRTTSPSVVAVGKDDDSLQTSLLEAVERPETPIAVNDDVVTHPQTSLLGSKTPVGLDVDVEAQDTSERSQSAPPKVMPDPFSGPYHDPNLSIPQRFRVYLRERREKHGLIRGVIYVFTIRPAIMFLNPFIDMLTSDKFKREGYRVPTFYSPPSMSDAVEVLVAIPVATVFGGIHCIAWSFEFPTVIEKWLWRVSAVLVFGLPLSLMFFLALSYLIHKKYRPSQGRFMEETVFMIVILSSLLYISARGVLLILPLIGLRALPAGAHIDLNWTAYLPHI
ncbi:hypothetical protein CVT25_000358 [Psilocybe cyanescens]|uniref:Uncharacterized protein n=1 Tax=Psilocybe cyanescens TaxID=93625 RepID=A0A409X3K8_PSICY|nr:hypothetical protein CVT25_000358 [Psilocybe cyanescens]